MSLNNFIGTVDISDLNIQVGDFFLTTDWIDGEKDEGYSLPSYSKVRISKIVDRQQVFVHPFKVDQWKVYEDVSDYWEPNYDNCECDDGNCYCDNDDALWDEVYWRIQDMMDTEYLIGISKMRPVDISPPINYDPFLCKDEVLTLKMLDKFIKKTTPKKKLRVHKLSKLLKNKIRGFRSRVLDFFKKRKNTNNPHNIEWKNIKKMGTFKIVLDEPFFSNR